MTHDYVLNAARALKEAGAGEGRGEGEPFRFVYVSGEGADTTGKSSQMWARVKVRSSYHALRSGLSDHPCLRSRALLRTT